MALRLLRLMLLNKEIERKKRFLNKESAAETAKDLETSNTNKTCRVCGGAGEIEIFASHHDRNLAEDMRQCSGVPVYLNDGCPSTLCGECVTLLQCAVKFREMCRRSAEKFLRLRLDRPSEEIHLSTMKVEHETRDYWDEWNHAPSSPELDSKGYSAGTRTCRVCQQEFFEMTTYREHLFECKKSRKSKKDKEKTQPNGTKEHLCEICGKALSTIHSLISHRTTHQNVFPFQCDLCQYRGKTAGLLRTHRKNHFAEKPHACSVCPKAFRTASNLRKHLQIHKGLEESVQCAYCEKTLRNKETLRSHIYSVHAVRPPVACGVCGKQFKGMRALYKHRSRIHNWRAEYSGRVPGYMRCQPDEPESAATYSLLSAVAER